MEEFAPEVQAIRPVFLLVSAAPTDAQSGMPSPLPPTASARRLVAAVLLALASAAGCATGSYSEKPGTAGDGSFTIGPAYAVDSDLADKGNPKGRSFEFTMRLADRKVFRGDDRTLEPAKKPVRTERKISVYVPAAYRDGTPAPRPP